MHWTTLIKFGRTLSVMIWSIGDACRLRLRLAYLKIVQEFIPAQQSKRMVDFTRFIPGTCVMMLAKAWHHSKWQRYLMTGYTLKN